MKEFKFDILIVGGGLGGVAAALAACRAGCHVLMTEETDWLGGQATSQGVPLDEHPWIEQYGSPASYREFRNRIRSFYRLNYSLSQAAQMDPAFNPGACWVSALGFEPRVGMMVLEEMLAPYRTAGLLLTWMRTKAVSAQMNGDRIEAITFTSTDFTTDRVVTASFVLDATELGDLLPMIGAEHVIGAESRAETGEPLALDEADPLKQQPFTHLIALDYRPDEEPQLIDKPDNYESYRSIFSKVVGKCDSLRAGDIIGTGMPKGLFSERNASQYVPDLWNFRRYFYQGNFDSSFFRSDITSLMVGNEYSLGVLCGVSEDEKARSLKGARDLSLSLVHYLQTEVPFMGGEGISGLRVRQDTFDTLDGLAKYPYIRESRRIKAQFTIREQDFLISENPHGPKEYFDSVGLAGYRIDIHEKAKGRNESITSAVHGQHWTQQIPLGALIPERIENLLTAGKCLGTTHVTNGAYRLHPVEWNIGEAAGSLAAFCLAKGESPCAIRNTNSALHDFQSNLVRRGVELHWPSQHFGMSYFSQHRTVENWYFGECDKLDQSYFCNRSTWKGETNDC